MPLIDQCSRYYSSLSAACHINGVHIYSTLYYVLQCPFVEIGRVSAEAGTAKNFTIHANHTTYLKLTVAHEGESSTQLLCA